MGMGKPEEITEFKKRTLIVVLQPENEKVIEKLAKRGYNDQIPIYKKMVNEYNESLRTSFESNWPYEQTIEYKEWSEVKDLHKSKSSEFSVALIYQLNYKYGGDMLITPYLDWNFKSVVKGDYDEGDKDFGKETTYLRLVLIENLNRSMPIAITGLANIYPTKTDIITGIYGTKYYMDMRMKGEGGMSALKEAKIINPKLKTMTLLIRENDLSVEFPKGSVKSHYPFKFKVIADSTMDRNILDKIEGMAYIVDIPFANDQQVIYSQEIFDCETGDWLGSVIPSIGAMYAGNYVGRTGKGRLTDKVFDKLVEQINGK